MLGTRQCKTAPVFELSHCKELLMLEREQACAKQVCCDEKKENYCLTGLIGHHASFYFYRNMK